MGRGPPGKQNALVPFPVLHAKRPRPAGTALQVSKWRPCVHPPASQVIPGNVCDPAYRASCMDIPCRTTIICFRLGSRIICVAISEEFNSTRTQFPRCRPKPNSNCLTRAERCGEFVKYLGNCGGIRYWSFPGYIATCQ